MKKIVTSLTLSFMILQIVGPAFAQEADTGAFTATPQTTGTADTSLLDDTSDIVNNFNADTAQAKLQIVQSELDKVAQRISELDKRADTLNPSYKEVRQQVIEVMQEAQAAYDKLTDTVKKLNLYKLQTTKLAQDMKDQKNDIDNTKALIVQMSQSLYQANNELYATNSVDIDTAKLLLTSDNVPDTLANGRILESMILQLEQLMTKLQTQQQTHATLLKKVVSLHADAKTQIAGFAAQIESLDEKATYLDQFLTLFEENKVVGAKVVKSLFDTKKDIFDEVGQIITDVASGSYSLASFNMAEKMQYLKSLKQFVPDRVTAFAWPVLPIPSITTSFKDPAYLQKNWTDFLGIEVPTTLDSPVYAARDAIVYKVVDSPVGVSRVVLVHDDGYITTYSQLDKIYVNEGDVVRRGQVIGASSGAPTDNVAAFAKDLGGLDFQIIKDGVYRDPLSYLDLSVIMNENILPIKAQVKYMTDVYNRKLDVSKMQFIDGDTPMERRVNFLEKYGVGVYRQSVFREKASEDTNIDTDVGICIAFAESTLGNYLSTVNNIGNVGNNDRGDRIPFSSTLDGARSIYRTLNNGFLNGYNSIDELSRRGNNNGSIYASSPINRQTNVQTCLTQIKGYYVPESYPFRTGPVPGTMQSMSGAVASGAITTTIKE